MSGGTMSMCVLLALLILTIKSGVSPGLINALNVGGSVFSVCITAGFAGLTGNMSGPYAYDSTFAEAARFPEPLWATVPFASTIR